MTTHTYYTTIYAFLYYYTCNTHRPQHEKGAHALPPLSQQLFAERPICMRHARHCRPPRAQCIQFFSKCSIHIILSNSAPKCGGRKPKAVQKKNIFLSLHNSNEKDALCHRPGQPAQWRECPLNHKPGSHDELGQAIIHSLLET